MAKKNPTGDGSDDQGNDSTRTEARVLVDSEIDGVKVKIDDIVELSGDELDAQVAQSHVDPHPDAVAYAKALKAQS